MAHRGFLIVMVTALGAALVSSLVFLAAGAGTAEAAFPGENGKIAFAQGGDIWTMDPDGTGQENLTNTPDSWEGQPAVSADGSRMAFRATWEQEEGTFLSGIVVMDADGTNRAILPGTTSYDDQPAWSPDGSKIAFVRDKEVWVMNADGSGQTQLTRTNQAFPTEGSENLEPTWSPDGEKIAFASDRNGQCNYELGCYDFDIWTMNPDGTGLQNTTDPVNDGQIHSELSPAWSPDGEHVAFAASGQIFETSSVDPADVDGWTRLAPKEPCDRLASDSSCYLADPTYSPDGEKIAYQKGYRALFVADRYGPGETKVAEEDTGFLHYEPNWGPECTSCPEVAPTDDTKPTITGTRPSAGSEVRDRTPTIRAVVRDETDKLAKADITLRVDGRERGFSYDPDTDRLSHATNRLSLGRHTVEVEAGDAAGNAATERWSFRVVKRR